MKTELDTPSQGLKLKNAIQKLGPRVMKIGSRAKNAKGTFQDWLRSGKTLKGYLGNRFDDFVAQLEQSPDAQRLARMLKTNAKTLALIAGVVTPIVLLALIGHAQGHMPEQIQQVANIATAAHGNLTTVDLETLRTIAQNGGSSVADLDQGSLLVTAKQALAHLMEHPDTLISINQGSVGPVLAVGKVLASANMTGATVDPTTLNIIAHALDKPKFLVAQMSAPALHQAASQAITSLIHSDHVAAGQSYFDTSLKGSGLAFISVLAVAIVAWVDPRARMRQRLRNRQGF